ncbi:MAG: funZ protein [Bacteroidia bacterium]|nr:funZ protein [Bacteroidia bacterium]
MKKISELNLGFIDAENYQGLENKELFNRIFVKNKYLDRIFLPHNYFLIGDKGTGKTAYAIFLTNNHYNNTKSDTKFIRETDYEKFITLKREKHLQLSDYTSIWKVIILLLLSNSLTKEELDYYPFNKGTKMKILLSAINEYYSSAFSPEIIYALNFIENNKIAAELISKYLKVGEEQSQSTSFQESKFQVNLLYIEKKFIEAISNIKLKNNHFLFIDGIDVRPGEILFSDYLECVKGLANAVWSLNADFFTKIKDSTGRFKVILLLRPDIYYSLSLQNSTNKLRDNSVYLDWRTTYPEYRDSELFCLADKLLNAQQNKTTSIGKAWDHYVPWCGKSTFREREYDPSFYKFLQLSYSRPRDIITMLQILQSIFIQKNHKENEVFQESDFDSHDFQNQYSQYLMGGIRDQLSFYYTNSDFELFLKFFQFLNGKVEFDYDEYIVAYKKFEAFLFDNCKNDIPEFVESADGFLQFLYVTNMICYYEELLNGNPMFHFCYKERNFANISPKVKSHEHYRIHYGLAKELNLGRSIK